MNNLYFACANCKIYIDAGYRWAYWQLEDPGVVDRKNDVDVSAVLKREEYWNPPNDENSGWLYEEIFPPLREFFVHHNGHRIVFGTGEDLAPDMDDYDFEWMNIGYLAKPTVRYLYEVVGLRSWNELCEFIWKRASISRVGGATRYREILCCAKKQSGNWKNSREAV